jgi:hypothetical protein
MTYNCLITDRDSPGYYQNEEYFRGIDIWARRNCASYVGYQVHDVTDTSSTWHGIADYEFKDLNDHLIFTLKWA